MGLGLGFHWAMGQIILPGIKSAVSRLNFHAIHILAFVHLWLPKGWTVLAHFWL